MKISSFLPIILVAGTLYSCSSTTRFPVSAVTPAAETTARIHRDKNKNYVINLSVKHLAPPERLSPPKQYYVAWISTQDTVYHNIGMLTTSQQESASLTAVTPYKPENIFITAENAGNVSRPGDVILRSNKIDVRNSLFP